MPTNNKQQEAKVIDAEVLQIDGKDGLNDLIDGDFEEPIKPLKEYREEVQNKKSKAYKFYFSCLPKLQEWWDEFQTSLDEKGGQRYKNAFQFARAKGKDEMEQEVIYEMIGPEPDKSRTKVPWLGDWKRKRMAGYYSPALPHSIKKLATACRQELENVKAIKSTAPFLVQELAMYSKMSEAIMDAFNGQMFLPDMAPEDFKNMGRAKAMIVLQKSLTRMKLDLIDRYWKAHGMNSEKPETMVTLNQQVNIAQVNAGMDSLTAADVETMKLAKMLKAHAENFNMPLPTQEELDKDKERARVLFNNDQAKEIDGNTGKINGKGNGKVQ